MDEDEELHRFGTPLPVLDEDDVPAKKPIYAEDQIVTDENGRRRFHGAFTGGFSAGFWNTVGSLHGWVPQMYKSSRSERAGQSKQQRPEDFMDDEDLGEFGIAPQRIQASEDFAKERKKESSGKRKFLQEAAGPIPGKPVLAMLLKPVKDKAAVRILKSMGWRPGQGVGPRQTRKQKKAANARNKRELYIWQRYCDDDDESMAMKKPEDSNADDNDDDDDSEDEDDDQITFAPTDIEPLFLKSKTDTFGFGYTGLTGTSSSVALTQEASSTQLQRFDLFEPLQVMGKNNKKLSIAGQAFGVGALEEEDEDIYARDDMTKYDFTLGDKQKKAKANKAEQLQDRNVIEGFIEDTSPLLVKPPHEVDIPRDFKPRNWAQRKSRFEPLNEERQRELQQELKQHAVGRHNLNADKRGQLLGEESEVIKELPVQAPDKRQERRAERTKELLERITAKSSNFTKGGLITSDGQEQLLDSSDAKAEEQREKSLGMPTEMFQPFLGNDAKQLRYEKFLESKLVKFSEISKFLQRMQPAEMSMWDRAEEVQEFIQARNRFEIAKNKIKYLGMPTEKFQPFLGNDEKQLRYEKFLESKLVKFSEVSQFLQDIQPAQMSMWDRAEEVQEFIHARNRFVSEAKQREHSDLLERAKNKTQSLGMPTEMFQPFLGNDAKQLRYEKFLESKLVKFSEISQFLQAMQPAEMSMWDRAEEVQEFIQARNRFEIAKNKIKYLGMPTEKFQPFLGNDEKQLRYEKFLESKLVNFSEVSQFLQDIQPAEMSMWDRAEEVQEFIHARIRFVSEAKQRDLLERAKNKTKSLGMPTEKFQPFLGNAAKQLRYEKFLETQLKGFSEVSQFLQDLQPVEMSMWDRAAEVNEFIQARNIYKPLGGIMSDRFISEAKLSAEQAVKAAAEAETKVPGKVIKMERSKKMWKPAALLCKRYNIAEPFGGTMADDEQKLLPKPKISVFDYLEVSVNKKENFQTPVIIPKNIEKPKALVKTMEPETKAEPASVPVKPNAPPGSVKTAKYIPKTDLEKDVELNKDKPLWEKTTLYKAIFDDSDEDENESKADEKTATAVDKELLDKLVQPSKTLTAAASNLLRNASPPRGIFAALFSTPKPEENAEPATAAISQQSSNKSPEETKEPGKIIFQSRQHRAQANEDTYGPSLPKSLTEKSSTTTSSSKSDEQELNLKIATLLEKHKNAQWIERTATNDTSDEDPSSSSDSASSESDSARKSAKRKRNKHKKEHKKLEHKKHKKKDSKKQKKTHDKKHKIKKKKKK